MLCMASCLDAGGPLIHYAAVQRTQMVYLERMAGLGAKGAADDVDPDVKMLNPIAAMDSESPTGED